MTDASQIHEVVQGRYGAIAAGVQSSCCGSDNEASDDCCGDSGKVQLYDDAMLAGLPVDVTGCRLAAATL